MSDYGDIGADVERWVAALEGDTYQHGRGRLRCSLSGRTRHCCLGVLADLEDPEGWTPEDRWGRVPGSLDLGYTASLPSEMVPGALQSILVHANDASGTTDYGLQARIIREWASGTPRTRERLYRSFLGPGEDVLDSIERALMRGLEGGES